MAGIGDLPASVATVQFDKMTMDVIIAGVAAQLQAKEGEQATQEVIIIKINKYPVYPSPADASCEVREGAGDIINYSWAPQVVK